MHEVQEIQPDVYLAVCPSRQVLSRIGEKWTSLVMGLLQEHPHRFAELERRIQGISRKMLTQTLRLCERDGLVSREMTGDKMPVKVVYAITPLGMTLIPVINQAKAWAQDNLKAVEAARQAYLEKDGVRIPIKA